MLHSVNVLAGGRRRPQPYLKPHTCVEVGGSRRVKVGGGASNAFLQFFLHKTTLSDESENVRSKEREISVLPKRKALSISRELLGTDLKFKIDKKNRFLINIEKFENGIFKRGKN